jgi:hypothetical protein
MRADVRAARYASDFAASLARTVRTIGAAIAERITTAMTTMKNTGASGWKPFMSDTASISPFFTEPRPHTAYFFSRYAWIGAIARRDRRRSP